MLVDFRTVMVFDVKNIDFKKFGSLHATTRSELLKTRKYWKTTLNICKSTQFLILISNMLVVLTQVPLDQLKRTE